MTSPAPYTYPFGQPVTPRPPSASGPRRFFVIGAYPSALHVEWIPPSPFKRIQAIPVDDEPTPFWTGHDQEDRVARWREAVGFKASWGSVRANAKFNGPSGQTVAEKILTPVGITNDTVWITDVLDTYRASVGVAGRIVDTYTPWATSSRVAASKLPPHPSENEIVTEGLRDHRERLLRELGTARPEVVITLGNAALRVLRELVGDDGPKKLALEGYGAERSIRLAGGAARWFPLAHPAAPPAYMAAHEGWLSRRGG